MGECPSACCVVRMRWLEQIFDPETGPAHLADQFFPTVQIFQRAFFPVPAARNRRRWAFALVR